MGLDGRSFQMYKFRSMRVDAELDSGPVWAAAGDSLSDANFWLDVKASFLRVTAGFLLAAGMALPIGLVALANNRIVPDGQ